MDAVFPITQRNGEPYHTLSDFTKLFDQVKSGRYLLGQGYGWHSGVHLTSKMVPWGKGLRPIQAMMDGKIVAYRIHADYQTTTYKDQELKYSNNFVLLEHEYKNPEKDDEVFKLYSLYMHLAPPSDIGANSSLTTRYKLVDDGWNVRTFKLGGAPERGKVESKVSMSSGTVLEYLHAEEQETVEFEIGDHTYKMIKCRVVQLGDSPSPSEKKMKGKIVWFAAGFAAGKDRDFAILNNTSVMVPEPVSEPEWMSKNAASLRDGSVVTLGLPLPLNIDFGAIEVKAGDELGYMGLHEYSKDANATKKEDNRVHIELFSVEKPPEFFLKKIAPKNAEESPLITIDGSGSNGALSVSNSFYSQLLEELSKGEEVDFSAFKPREAKVYLENKRKHFERVIAKHPSDWYTDVTKDSYSMIHQLAKEVMDEKYMTGFVSEKDYLESPWRSEVMNHHDMFSQHERERADKFSWMQDTQSKITLPDDKSVWHYWPFLLNSPQSTDAELRLRAFMRMLRVGEGTIGEIGYETLFGGASFIRDYKKDWSDHPRLSMPFGKSTSSAAGAYQIMAYTWDDGRMKIKRRKYSTLITDFSPLSQDYACIILLKYYALGYKGKIQGNTWNEIYFGVDGKRQSAYDLIVDNKIEEAIKVSSFIWASLPPGIYGQPSKTMDEALRLYNMYYEEETQGSSDLHLPSGFIQHFNE